MRKNPIIAHLEKRRLEACSQRDEAAREVDRIDGLLAELKPLVRRRKPKAEAPQAAALTVA